MLLQVQQSSNKQDYGVLSVEVYGNMEYIKSEIEKRFSDYINAVEKEAAARLEMLRKETDERLEVIRAQIQNKADEEAKMARARLVNGQKLNAKRAFEEKREKLINIVLERVRQTALKKVHSKQYLDFVNEQIPEGEAVESIGDSDYYKRIFPKLTIDNSIVGIKFRTSDITYDLTIDGAIKSKHDKIRDIITCKLFQD